MPGAKERIGRKQVWLQKGNMTPPCGDGNVLYLDYIDDNIMVVKLRYVVWQEVNVEETG